MNTTKQPSESEEKKTSATFYIKIMSDGPLMVYGNPPIDQQIITLNSYDEVWSYRQGASYNTGKSPVALCRCGASRNKPYCDGSHARIGWDGTECASRLPLLENSERTEGPTMVLADNEKYCAFARFCDAQGRVWNLVASATTEGEKELVHHEVGHCPGGRLVVWDKKSKEPYEPAYEPSIGLIEDPAIKVSGPIWVRGGIRIEGADGHSYEVRNRVALCRCGLSANKPFCDGTHASSGFDDGLL